ncbi:MAG: hypothetical protein BHV99_06260 [Clostridium sp. 26_21]|nr:MAG: hypothetical protein BHV99_06260 [Clostridium sp. 26_21]
MKKKGKMFRNALIFIILIVLTFYILLKDQNPIEILNIIFSARLEFVFMGILCMFIYIILEAQNIGRTLKKLNEKSTFIKNIKYALIGFFFSSVTPAASGGQPMQIYYMYKDGISVSNSTLALLLNLTSMQISTISIALVSLIFNYKYLNKLLIILFIIGILLNSSALILLLIGVFSKRLSQWLIKVAIKILEFFKVKNLDAKKEKFETELMKYQEGARYVKKNKILMVKILITTLVQFLVYYSVTYWTYRALGFSENNILKMISIQSILYATVSGIPSPGAVGVTEGAFTEIFRNIYPANVMSSAVLLNRGINFYLLVIVSGIITIINHLNSEKEDVKEEEDGRIS